MNQGVEGLVLLKKTRGKLSRLSIPLIQATVYGELTVGTDGFYSDQLAGTDILCSCENDVFNFGY